MDSAHHGDCGDPKDRVLVLFTGGTIGMTKVENGEPMFKRNFLRVVRNISLLHDSAYAREIGLSDDLCVLPVSDKKKRIIYKLIEYSDLKDSSNICIDDWVKITKDINENYSKYSGFVILHGTDTMAHTASALSFMMENLDKAVILTGSQVALSDLRSDGFDNLLGAVYIAGHYSIPEVSLFFNNRLFRGNRTVKISADHFNAFDSPNLPPLVTMAVDSLVEWRIIRRPPASSEFRVHTNFNRNVGLLKLYPGITMPIVHAFFQPPMEGVVLETYGVGNFPSDRKDLLREIEMACSRGLIAVNCTQCPKGIVSSYYETGSVLVKAGVVPGLDMTPEAALCKLSYVLSLTNLNIEEKRKRMSSNIRGELTDPNESEVAGLSHLSHNMQL